MTTCVRTRAARFETSTATIAKKDQRRDIGRIGDREGVERRKEKEVVGERGRDDSDERGPEAEANRNGDDGRQEHEVDVLEPEEGLDELAHSEGASNAQQRDRHKERHQGRLSCCVSTVFLGTGSRSTSSPAIT